MCKLLKDKKIWFAAVLGTTFLLIWVLTTLTPNGVDDYVYLYIFRTETRVASFGDIFTSMVTHWNVWGGRVVAHTFVQFFLWMPKAVYNLGNAVMFTWFIYLMYRFAKTDAKEISLKLLLGIVTFLWLFLPAFAQNIFWLTGSCNYLWGVTFILAWLLQFKLHLDAPKQHSVCFTVVFTLLSVCMGAYSENTSAAAMLAAGLMMLYMLYQKIKWQLWMLTSLVGAFVGWLFLVLAPGNSARAETEEVGWSMLAKCYNRVLTAIKMWQINLLPVVILFAVLLVVALHQKVAAKQIHMAVLMAFTAFACNFAMVLSPTYPLRACLSVFVFLLIGCGILFQSVQAEWFSLAAKCVLAVALMLTMADVLVSGEAILQCYTMEQDREEELQASIAAGDLDFEMYNIVSDNDKCIYSSDIGWFYPVETVQFNVAFARYYGLDSVVVTHELYYGQTEE